jgi:cellulose synthase operon protein YhjQ
MKEFNPPSDQNPTPEDVATLYSWANLHGAKYRDFSASRAQTREAARLRAEEALQQEQQSREMAEAAQTAEAEREAEEARAAEAAREAELAAEHAAFEAEQAAQQAAAEAAQLAAQQAAEHAARIEAEEAARQAARRLQEQAAQLVGQQAAQRAAEQEAEREAERQAELEAQQEAGREAEQAAQQRAWEANRTDRFVPPEAPNYPPPQQSPEYTNFARPQAYRPPPSTLPGQPPYPAAREENTTPRNPWATQDKEPASRPAWLSNDQPEPSAQPNPYASAPQTPRPYQQAPPVFPQATSSFTQAPPSFAQAPEDTLQGSRDRLTSRWFALRGVFDGNQAVVEPAPAPVIARAPSLAVFSLAGGVGKTSLVATLGRALSARGERVLLVDTAAFGLLPFFFGATDQRPGLLRTFSPPGASTDAPIQMVTIDPEGIGSDQNGNQPSPESLSAEILKFAHGSSRILVDLATASGATTRRIMRMSPLVLVPVIPDMNSVVSVSSIDAFFEHNNNASGKPSLPFYLLNQFDASLPLHLDVREVLREQLGERLLPFAMRRTPAMSEALAEGMTVMDYAPGSTLAEDFATLAGWVKSLSAPATTNYRGVRWSER